LTGQLYLKHIKVLRLLYAVYLGPRGTFSKLSTGILKLFSIWDVYLAYQNPDCASFSPLVELHV